MKCKDTIELLSVCNEAELTKAEKTAINSHLANCAECRQESELLYAMQRKLRTGFQTREIYAPDMADSIMASLPSNPTIRPTFTSWKWATAATCLALSLVSSFYLFHRSPISTNKQETKTTRAAVVEPKPSAPVIHVTAQTTTSKTKITAAPKAIKTNPSNNVRKITAYALKNQKRIDAKPSDKPSPESIAELNTPCVQFTLPGVDPTRADDQLAMNTRRIASPTNQENP